ncbi:fibronectin type III domain-containing protein [Marinilabilia salmonicolor]|uniref:fibronectin type III domain-containing protein n=1 Tax=Marinilabilia salmonicolor TaxID=989 RepID=UPI0015F036D3|nr:fibronectin type III domain-containing protein [Marinilabilia salmonicolor]
MKNKTENTQTISIDKEATFPYPVHNWVSIANNSINVTKGGTATFLLTVTIPNSPHEASNGIVSYTPELTAKTDGGSSTGFSGSPFSIIIDNEPPRNVTITQKNATNNQVVVSFSAYDDWSHWYSNQTENAHSNGIKKYTITLKSKDGSTTVTSGTCEGRAASRELTLSHSAIQPNTEYNASVKATDLAGNSQNASVGVKTAPSIPQNFSTSDLYYTGVTLHWNACAGATNYRVYLYESGSSNYINSYPTNTNSINITGLQDDKTYQVTVKSGSAVGESRLSSKYSFTTPGITIVGSSIVCEQDDFGLKVFCLVQ